MSVVYFVRMGGSVKIGVARNLERRLSTLRTNCAHPLEVIGTIPGSFSQEKSIHDELREFRLNGEWFSDNAPVRSAIDRYLAGNAPKPRKARLHLTTRKRSDGPSPSDIQSLFIAQKRLEFADARSASLKAEIALCEAILAAQVDPENSTVVGE